MATNYTANGSSKSNKRKFETILASIQDSQIDLIKTGEMGYRNRCYFEAPCKDTNHN